MDDGQGTLFEMSEPVMGDVERWCSVNGYRWIIGVDEAGRGPLAGPVYAAAVAVDVENLETKWLEGLDDSKKLERLDREAAFELIKRDAPAWRIEYSDRSVIDEINILQATLRAMERAVERVCGNLDCTPDYVFVDGNSPIDIELTQRPLVGGDARSLAIAAASILAKVSRDEVMREHHETWPDYNFASNKGYPTPDHRKAIAEHGPCDIHRRTFGGVKEHLDE